MALFSACKHSPTNISLAYLHSSSSICPNNQCRFTHLTFVIGFSSLLFFSVFSIFFLTLFNFYHTPLYSIILSMLIPSAYFMFFNWGYLMMFTFPSQIFVYRRHIIFQISCWFSFFFLNKTWFYLPPFHRQLLCYSLSLGHHFDLPRLLLWGSKCVCFVPLFALMKHTQTTVKQYASDKIKTRQT